MTAITLVTGGNGFIGGNIVRQLAGAGHTVRSGMRRPRQSPLPGVTSVACDLDRSADLGAAVAGVTSVVHCAYGNEAAMAAQCASLLAAMTAGEVSRLVYFSSIAVYGDKKNPSLDAPISAADLQGTYAIGKARCEALIRAWANEQPGRRAIILRPGVVYGKKSPFWIEKLSERIRAGIWGDFGALGAGAAPLVHVDDVGAVTVAAIEALEHPSTARASVEVFDVIGPETPSWNDYFHALAKAIAAPPLRPVRPGRVKWRQAMAIPAKLWRRAGLPGGRRAALAPTAGELAVFSRHARYDRASLPAKLGIVPQIGLEDGLKRSV